MQRFLFRNSNLRSPALLSAPAPYRIPPIHATKPGLGFFDFQPANILELGPNADAFRLQGTLKTQRFIRIDQDANLYIPAGKGIDLQRGAVENHGTIELGSGGAASFRSNRIYGDNDLKIGINGTNVANFTVTDCIFDGNFQPIRLEGASSQFTNLTQIKTTIFQNYLLRAVEIHHRGGILYENCTFKGQGASDAGVVSKFNLVTILRNCTLQDHNNPQQVQTGNPLVGLQASVIVDGDWICWMDGGEIRNGVVGILNSDLTDAAPCNVIMSHQATIRDCYAGVAIRGNATIGQIIMDCARLIGNQYGIYAEDAGIVISPELLSQQTTGIFYPGRSPTNLSFFNRKFKRSLENSTRCAYLCVRF